MEIDGNGNENSVFENRGGQYQIVDVDDGIGNVDQVIVTNDEAFDGLSFEQEREADNFVGRRYGKYTAIGNGMIVIGPQICKLLCFVGAILAIGGILVLLFNPISNYLDGWVFWLGECLVVISVILLLLTSLTDPGVVPRDFDLGQYLIEMRSSQTPACQDQPRPKWCRKCQATRPPRCYHCLQCDICIRRQDMHLLIGGVCVGSRNFRQYLAFNVMASILSFYLTVVGVILIIKLLQSSLVESAFMRADFNLPCLLLFCGAILMSFPQTGFIMFIYRLYLLSKNRTVREEYRAYIRGNNSNPFDNGVALNIWEFLIKKIEPSYFRKKNNQVNSQVPLRRWRVATFTDFPHRRDSQFLFFPRENFQTTRGPDHHFYLQRENLRQNLNATAKVKSNKSALLHKTLLLNSQVPVPGRKWRKQLYPKPFDVLQKEIENYQEYQKLPKSFTNVQKFKCGSQSRSESNLVEGKDSTWIVHQARAFQIQQIISCVLRRDRRGLIELARRVNVAGLIGIDHFDPDDIQMIELNNGLPLLSSRTQNVRQGQGQQAAAPTQAVLGIPQMIAAGLMTTLRRQQQQAAASLALARLHTYNNNNDNSVNLRSRTLNNFTTLSPTLSPTRPSGNQIQCDNNYVQTRRRMTQGQTSISSSRSPLSPRRGQQFINGTTVTLTPSNVPSTDSQSRNSPSASSTERDRTTGQNEDPLVVVFVNDPD